MSIGVGSANIENGTRKRAAIEMETDLGEQWKLSNIFKLSRNGDWMDWFYKVVKVWFVYVSIN